jgi:uncharacterized membrane protein YbhN (UPF0104 family)
MIKARPILIFLIKLLVSGGLIAFFLTRVDLQGFVQTLLSANFSWIGLALAVYLCSQAVSAMRWNVLVRPLGIIAPFKDIVCYYLIGMFFNLFAPGTVGGDVSRVYYLVRHQAGNRGAAAAPMMRAAVSVFMDRAIGMLVLIWVGAAGLLLFPHYPVPRAIRILTLSLALGLALAAALVPLFRRLLPELGSSTWAKLRLALRSYGSHRHALVNGVLLSLAVHLIQSWMHVLMGRALNLTIPFSFCLIVYPLVGTFSAIPISLNGIGLREGGYVLLLGVIGISTEKGVAFGLLLFLIIALDSLIGGIIFLLKRTPEPARAPSPERTFS